MPPWYFLSLECKPRKKALEGKTSLNVTLQENKIGLDEVVVIGYGTTQRKNLTGAVDQVSSTIIDNRPVSNTVQALSRVHRPT